MIDQSDDQFNHSERTLYHRMKNWKPSDGPFVFFHKWYFFLIGQSHKYVISYFGLYGSAYKRTTIKKTPL